MTKRRISIPEDHVALILPAQLADELQSLMSSIRRSSKAPLETKSVAGDIILALLEAKEA